MFPLRSAAGESNRRRSVPFTLVMAALKLKNKREYESPSAVVIPGHGGRTHGTDVEARGEKGHGENTQYVADY